ncbi:MAG: DUF4263 domain-containing protein [Mycoplasmatales bacterium]|nr:DUF4263 domain-containing protein [Mycoplasmatales bacterium]
MEKFKLDGKLIFKHVVTKESPGNIFKTDELSYDYKENKYKLIFSLQENASEGKLHTRIDKLVKLVEREDGLVDEKVISKYIYSNISNQLGTTIVKIEGQYLLYKSKKENELLSATSTGKGMFESLSTESIVNLFSDIHVDLSKNMSLIPKKFSNEELESIIDTNNSGEIMKISLLKRLKEFNNKWNFSIKMNHNEQKFQNLLSKYPEIITVIFPRIKNLKKIEYLIESENETDNKVDILANGDERNTIIELKKPSTNLFTSSKRNNISGLSKELISASVQLSLYNRRIQHKALKLLDSFTYGILIIGHTNQMNTNDKKLSWKLYKNDFNYDIYTFDEISKFVDKIIENIK